MPLIEGVGDEVTDFFIIVGILLVIWIAWCSTSITDQPLIRTVLVLQQRTRTRIAELRLNQAANLVQTASNIELSPEQNGSLDTNNVSEAGISCPESSSEDRSNISVESTAASATVMSEEMLIEAMDSSNSENSRPLQRPQANPSESAATNSDSGPNTTSEQVTEDVASNNEDKISIRLKFMNDDQKLVTASPKDILGDFKRQHFQMELESRKLVRLVFKGHILQPDSLSLERCGLYDNCVVHCLVHQPRSLPTNSSQTTADSSSSTLYFNPQDIPAGSGIGTVQHDWDLSKVLVSVMILILSLFWYWRYHYPQLFTATTTIALYVLTSIFTVSLFSHFFPDQETIGNVE